MLNVYICIWLYTLQMYTASDCHCIYIMKPFYRYYCSGKPQRSHIIGTLRRESLVVWPGCLSVSQGNVFWQKIRLSRFFTQARPGNIFSLLTWWLQQPFWSPDWHFIKKITLKYDFCIEKISICLKKIDQSYRCGRPQRLVANQREVMTRLLVVLYVYSCDQAALRTGLSVRPSVRPSVRLSVCLSVFLSLTPFSLCSYIVTKFSVITNDKRDVHAKSLRS